MEIGDQTTFNEFIDSLRPRITEMPTELLASCIEEVTLIDIREVAEYESGTLERAHLIPRGVLESRVLELAPNRHEQIVLYCSTGHRSVLAADTLQQLGYSRVSSLAGGLEKWKSEQRRWRTPHTLSSDQMARYARHLVLPQVGSEGQKRLLDSRVLIIGAGGLGSPVALYLAAAGVGTIGIVDFDTVDKTNLQRQIVHNTRHIGSLKVDSARDTIWNLNPDVTVETFPTRLDAANALSIMKSFDVIVDGTDTFPTRYLVNDASLHLQIPVVHGSIFRFEGQVTVFDPYNGPCYRCLFPEPPPPELAPSCAEAGVLGILPGVVGSIQATEALKILLQTGETLTGRLLLYDALQQDFTAVTIRRDPHCPACGDEANPPPIVDYDPSCVPAQGSHR